MLYNIVVGFVIHWHASAPGIHVKGRIFEKCVTLIRTKNFLLSSGISILYVEFFHRQVMLQTLWNCFWNWVVDFFFLFLLLETFWNKRLQYFIYMTPMNQKGLQSCILKYFEGQRHQRHHLYSMDQSSFYRDWVFC